MTDDLKEVLRSIDAGLEQAKANYDAARKTFQENLKCVFTPIFDAFPEIVAVVWTQYTPYFNDGDTCVFRRHQFSYCLKEPEDVRAIAREESEHSFMVYDYKEATPDAVLVAAVGEERALVIFSGLLEIEKRLEIVPDETYLEVFGDHVSVLATREGFDTEEYEHD